MPHTSHKVTALATLESLADQLESHEVIDVDYDGKMLSIELSPDQVYLLNYHEPMNQLWLSSPVSGAHHFSFEAGHWQSTRNKTGLNTLLAAELEHQLGYNLELSHA